MSTQPRPAGSRQLSDRLRHWLVSSRPVDRETEVAVARRWSELPSQVRTPAQLLGRRTPGCEGTHGVFPRCNLACAPCYHGQEAQSVPTDGAHTTREVERQMSYLRSQRGPGQHAQLIGGEVTLLGPESHAETLRAMERQARKPISMTHGDFDYEYLRKLALEPSGKPRFRRLRFAGHFDSLMLGRRAVKRPRTEAELDGERRRFVAMFERLRATHGVDFDLAHNMTVTPRNLDQVGSVARHGAELGFGMLSFQPAARIGNPSRWREDFDEATIDAVWAQLERGLGARLPWRHLQMGDARCNRSAYGVWTTVRGRRPGARRSGSWTPFLDDRDPRDLRVRDLVLDGFGAMDFERPRPQLAIAIARVLARHPRLLAAAPGWAWRFTRRAGLKELAFGSPRGLTIVVHAFIDAALVRPAWEALERGERADEPAIRAAQERLSACSYVMAHPDDDRLVPACVQHSVLDPAENRALIERLPAARHKRAGSEPVTG